MNNTSTVGAYDQHGNLVFIEDAEKKSIYRCPGCSGDLIPVKGMVNIHHYRHKVMIDSCSGPMTMLHKLAQDILLNMIHLHMPALYYMDHKVHSAHKLAIANVQKEPSLEDTRYRPDLICNSLGRDIWIEVTVTNKTKGDKLQYIQDNNILCIELDLSKVDRVISREDLSVICRAPEYLSYLNNPKVEQGKKKITERIAKFSNDAVRRDEWKDKEKKRQDKLSKMTKNEVWAYIRKEQESEDKKKRIKKTTATYYKGIWKDNKGDYDKAKYHAYHYKGIDKLWKIICHKEAYGVVIEGSVMIIKKVVSGKVITKTITLNDAFLDISTQDQASHVRSLFVIT
jgi:hypothetical protein